MTREELKRYINENIFSEKGKIKYSVLNKLDINIVEKIQKYTKFLETNDIKERIFYILNDKMEIILCPCCNKNKPNFISIKHGYFVTCSVKCSTIFSANKVYETKIKNNSFEKAVVANKKSKLEKYGDENFNNREKAKATCLEKYGVEHQLQNITVMDKLKNTCLEKYGVDNVRKSKEIKDKTKSTNIERYGVENPFQAEIVKDKIKETCLERYGVENYSQSGLNSTSGYKWKEYQTPNNNILRIQGYENKLFDELLKEYSEYEFITERKNMPEIWYIGTDNKQHRYFPDVYIPKTNTIYEVKSEYTLNVEYKKNELKFQAVKDAGYNFVLKVY